MEQEVRDFHVGTAAEWQQPGGQACERTQLSLAFETSRFPPNDSHSENRGRSKPPALHPSWEAHMLQSVTLLNVGRPSLI